MLSSQAACSSLTAAPRTRVSRRRFGNRCWDVSAEQRSATMSEGSAGAGDISSPVKPHGRRAQSRLDRVRAHVRPRSRNPYLDLFLISFAILFLELACIRWFGSAVLFLTFFTNLVLMACFLGMSVGLLATGRRQDLVMWVIPLVVVAVGLAELTGWAYARFGNLVIDVGGQRSPQQVFFGTESPATDLSRFVIPIEWIA